MSTTVSYKGATIATVSNDTKTLLTEGKYLEDDLTLTDVSGGGSTLITKNISANGTYNASSDSADGYSQVTVAVPASAVDTGTKNITANGSNQDVVGYAAVDVEVPNSYSASDEGKVVSNGALVAQTSDTVTANDTYDTTLINSLTVNVSGGGGSSDLTKMIDNTLTAVSDASATQIRRSAFAYLTSLVSASLPEALTFAHERAFDNCSNLETVSLPKITNGSRYGFLNCSKLSSVYMPLTRNVEIQQFKGCSSLVSIALPSLSNNNEDGLVSGSNFDGCSNLEIADLGNCKKIASTNAFNNCAKLGTLILRGSSVCTLNNINSFNNTPFASGGTGGTLYVPSSLISSYQAASNWSTILGYATNSIKSIESTHTDPTAPFDMTLYYADGTPISS